jgi:hypothetical protein
VTTVDLARRRLVRSFGVGGEADVRHELWRHRRPETYGAIATPGAYLAEHDLRPVYPAAPGEQSAARPAPQPAGQQGRERG